MTCLVPLCLLWRMVSHEPDPLPFVQGNPWSRAAKVQVTERCRQQHQAVSGRQLEADDKAKAKKLRSQLSSVESAKELIEILDEALDGPIFKRLQPSVAYSALAKLSDKRGLMPKDWDSPVISRMHDRVQDLASQGRLNADASAKILRTCAHLSHRFHAPTPLLVALVKSPNGKMRRFSAEKVLNILQACAKFNEPALDHILPDVFKQIPRELQQEFHDRLKRRAKQRLAQVPCQNYPTWSNPKIIHPRSGTQIKCKKNTGQTKGCTPNAFSSWISGRSSSSFLPTT